MIYLEYEEYKTKYLALQEHFHHVLLEKERLFTRALPNAIRYDKEHVQCSVDSNPLEEYAIAVDEAKIDETLKQLRQLLEDWERLLDIKKRELDKSQDVYDKIYRFRFIERYGINRIARSLDYSKSQVYRKLNQIQKRCDKMRKEI